MKRSILAILAFLYLSTATGANLHFHYCMGELASWSLWQNETPTCDKCGMDENTGCCKNESKHVILKLDQKSSNPVLNQAFIPLCEPVAPYISYFVNVQEQSTIPFLTQHARPRGNLLPVYLRICNFRI